MRFSPHREEEVGISLTPLIDVVFLLLIFFMVSTTFSKESLLNLPLPTSENPPETTLEKEHIYVSISRQCSNVVPTQYELKRESDPSVKRFNGSDEVELSKQMLPLVSGWENPRLMIHAHEMATFQSVVTAMSAAKRAGIQCCSFVVDKQP